MVALGQELQQRGHKITFFNIQDSKAKVLAAGLEHVTLGQSDHPAGSLFHYLEQMGNISGLSALRFGIETARSEANMICRDAPAALKTAGVEMLLIDQGEPAGAAVAEFLGIPFITICSGIAFNREAAVPPAFTPWHYQPSWWAFLRNQLGYSLFDWFTRPMAQVIAHYQQQWQQPIYRTLADSYSSLAQISPMTAEFDFPRTALPQCFHYIGLYRNASLKTVPFPFEQLNGQPLIYASMGTMQNRMEQIFHCIAAACEGLNAQLVISLGGSKQMAVYQNLPGTPLVVEYAPQLELLKRASLTITHGGTKTVLESLSQGTPMVAIPITNDQPGAGARLQWTGTGEVVALNHLSVDRLRIAIERVLTDVSYSKNALKLQESMLQSGGTSRAADIIEQVMTTGQPVLTNRHPAKLSEVS